MLIDIDHFKLVNDTFGHKAGDQVLKEIGGLFQRLVRSYDWVGRYGGEEFLLVLGGSDFPSAQGRAEEFRHAVESLRIEVGDAEIPVTASFGVAGGVAPDFEALIQAADSALYLAKRSGRNCVMATEVNSPESPSNLVEQS
jgi:diguanylate cyclase (GGDEF)-like protein